MALPKGHTHPLKKDYLPISCSTPPSVHKQSTSSVISQQVLILGLIFLSRENVLLLTQI